MSRKSKGAHIGCRQRRGVSHSVEGLERRVLFNATYQLLTSAALTQDWSNTALFGSANVWTNVPSIEGYLEKPGNSAAPDTNPNTLTAADLPSDGSSAAILNVDVRAAGAATTDISGLGTGEIAYWPSTTNTAPLNGGSFLAMQDSGTARPTFLVLYTNTTGAAAVNVSYSLRDIDTGTNTTGHQQYGLQYRVADGSGNFGLWNAFPNSAGYVADASDGTAGAATKVTNISTTLPSAALNQAKVQIRILTYDENGSDQFIAIGNINVAATAATTGSLGFSSSSYTVGEKGGTATITVARSGGDSGAASIHYSVAAGTAGTDNFDPVPDGILNFTDGQDSATFNVTVHDNSTYNTALTVNLGLSNASGATLGAPSSATLTIYDQNGSAPSGMLLNEVDANPPGTDNPDEYAEMIGSTSGPNNSLRDVYFVSLEGDGTNTPGIATYVANLGTLGQSGSSFNTLGTNGLALLDAADAGFTGVPSATTQLHDSQFDTATGILQNGANSFALVWSEIPIVQGTDYDSTNTGNPSQPPNLPSGAVVLDSFGWKDLSVTPAQANVVYGTLLGNSSGTQVPAAATRIPGHTGNAATDWYVGSLIDDGHGSTSVTYDLANASSTAPAGAVITPGAPNYSGVASGPGEVGFQSATLTYAESAGTVTLTLTRQAGMSGDVKVDYVFGAAGDTATLGADYSATNGTLDFPDGQTTATFSFTINQDTIIEPTESFTITLQNPTNGLVVGPRTTTAIRIGDDDTKLLLNEILVDAPFEYGNNSAANGATAGGDGSNEYIELEGTPGQTLQNMYFISVEGDSNSTIGNVTYVYNLSGVTVGSDGLILIHGVNNTLLAGASPSTTVLTDSKLDQTGGDLQNGSNSFLVVSSPSAIGDGSNSTTQTNVVDANKNLSLPFGATMIDGIGWLDGGANDKDYGADLTNLDNSRGLAAGGTAALGANAATRLPGDTDLLSSGAWYYGDLVGQDSLHAAADDRLIFTDDGDAGNFNSANPGNDPVNGPGFTYDANAHLTPGEPNYSIKSTNGALLSGETQTYTALDNNPNGTPAASFQYNATVPGIALDFNSDVSGDNTMGGTGLINVGLTNNTTGATIPGNVLAYSPNSSTAIPAAGPSPVSMANGYIETITFPTLPNKSLPDGYYTLTISAFTDNDYGVPMSGPITVKFFSLAGDANHDGIVNALDFNALASHYGQTTTFANGDFNYTGSVNSDDFGVLAANFGKVLTAPVGPGAVAEALPAAPATPGVAALSAAVNPMSLFSKDPITGSLASDIL